MFGLFKRKCADPLSQPGVRMIRSHARALIRFANEAEGAGSRDTDPEDRVRRETKEWQAMVSGETQLADSIAAAITGEFGLQAIVDTVIRPILEEAIVVSQTAHDAILRAVGMAAPDPERAGDVPSTRSGSS